MPGSFVRRTAYWTLIERSATRATPLCEAIRPFRRYCLHEGPPMRPMRRTEFGATVHSRRRTVNSATVRGNPAPPIPGVRSPRASMRIVSKAVAIWTLRRTPAHPPTCLPTWSFALAFPITNCQPPHPSNPVPGFPGSRAALLRDPQCRGPWATGFAGPEELKAELGGRLDSPRMIQPVHDRAEVARVGPPSQCMPRTGQCLSCPWPM